MQYLGTNNEGLVSMDNFGTSSKQNLSVGISLWFIDVMKCDTVKMTSSDWVPTID